MDKMGRITTALRKRVGLKALISLTLVAGFLTVLMTFGNAAGGQDWDLPENLVDGRDLYITKGCVKCHTIWGKGGTLGPDLSQIGRNRTLLQLAGLMWNHSKGMDEMLVEFGMTRPVLEVDEMEMLLSYLFFLNYFDEPGDFYEGERTFVEKRCADCHSVGGVGGDSATPLDHFKQDMSPLLLAQAMWNTGGTMSSKLASMGIRMPELHADDLSNLLAYIRGAAVGEPGEPKYFNPGNPKKGKEKFDEMGCSSCHGIRGDGPSVGPDLSSHPEWQSVSEYAANMWNHSDVMWARMDALNREAVKFEGNELADVIAYLYYNYYFDEPGDPVKGRALFKSKNCDRCHQVGGVGVATGLDIAESESLGSSVELATSMWNHAPIMAELFATERFLWPKFYGDEMRDLVSFIRSEAE